MHCIALLAKAPADSEKCYCKLGKKTKITGATKEDSCQPTGIDIPFCIQVDHKACATINIDIISLVSSVYYLIY